MKSDLFSACGRFVGRGNKCLVGRGSTTADSGEYALSEIESAFATLIVDVRMPEDFAAGYVPDAVNIATDHLLSRLTEITGHWETGVVLCGDRSARGNLQVQPFETPNSAKFVT